MVVLCVYQPTQASAIEAQSNSFRVINPTLTSGGGESSSAGFRLNSTIGGNLIGSSSSSNFKLDSGVGFQTSQLLIDTPSGTTTGVSGDTGAGIASSNVVGPWVFAPPGNGQFQTAGFIPVQGHPKSPPVAPPVGLSFPFGLFDFVAFNGAAGSSMTFSITYPGTFPPGSQYWKFGPTPSNQSPHWYVLPNVVFTANTATITIVDGGLGDDDLLANSMIVDEGGPAYSHGAATAIPTLSEWGMLLLISLIAVFAFLGRRFPKLMESSGGFKPPLDR